MDIEDILSYTRPSYVTMHDGTYFRSILEAIWASFLDDMVYRWRYEPKEFGTVFDGWLPDFVVFPSSRDRIPVLCEVKPLDLMKLPLMVTQKIEGSEQRDNDIPIVILGKKAPVWCQVSTAPLNVTSLGWVSYRRSGGKREWKPLPLTPFIELVRPSWITGCEKELIQLVRCTWESKEKLVKKRTKTAGESALTLMTWIEKDLKQQAEPKP